MIYSSIVIHTNETKNSQFGIRHMINYLPPTHICAHKEIHTSRAARKSKSPGDGDGNKHVVIVTVSIHTVHLKKCWGDNYASKPHEF